MINTTALNALQETMVRGYRDALLIRPYGEGSLISLPQSLTSGTILSVLVQEDGDMVSITDRGVVADELELVGVDIEQTGASRSWTAVKQSIGRPPAFGAESWELSSYGPREDMFNLIQAVADAALRADALRPLSRTHKSNHFREKIIHLAGVHHLPVLPNAVLQGKHGSKWRTTCRIDTATPHFVQALAGGSKNQRMVQFNRAVATFANADLDRTQLIAAFDDGDWEPWHFETLKDSAVPVTSSGLDAMMGQLAQEWHQ